MADEPSAMDAYDAEEANGSTSKSVSPVQINIESKNELVKERDILFDEVTTAEEVIAFIKRFPPSLKRIGITHKNVFYSCLSNLSLTEVVLAEKIHLQQE